MSCVCCIWYAVKMKHQWELTLTYSLPQSPLTFWNYHNSKYSSSASLQQKFLIIYIPIILKTSLFLFLSILLQVQFSFSTLILPHAEPHPATLPLLISPTTSQPAQERHVPPQSILKRYKLRKPTCVAFRELGWIFRCLAKLGALGFYVKKGWDVM